MDFGNYPPEINSARMYAGAGAGPLLVAAEAWDALAGELQSVANSYQSVVSGLTAGPWMGPASTSMSAAAASYAAWLQTTAAQAEETGAQAKSAAAAYQAAFTATVPPPMVAANRSLLSTLIATNLFGMNTQAIAANEAQYGEMWAQDTAAMYGYAASSASATQLTPFNPPQQNTNPGGSANQAAAVGQATGSAAGNVQSSIQQAFSAVPAALSSAAAAPAAAGDPLGTISDLIAIFLDAPAVRRDLRCRHTVRHDRRGRVSLGHHRRRYRSEHRQASSAAGTVRRPGRVKGTGPRTTFPAPITGR